MKQSGRPPKILEIGEESIQELENLQKTSKSSCVHQRCHAVLLKTQGYSYSEIARIVGFKDSQPVLRWVHRYQKNGIQGLLTKKGQGRPSILQEEDIEVVQQKVKNERQRLKLVKNEIEQELNKDFSIRTLKRFLKNLMPDGKG